MAGIEAVLLRRKGKINAKRVVSTFLPSCLAVFNGSFLGPLQGLRLCPQPYLSPAYVQPGYHQEKQENDSINSSRIGDTINIEIALSFKIH